MSTLLEDLQTYLKTNMLITDDGVDSFRDFLPDYPDNIVVLNEYSGAGSIIGVEVASRSVQVLVRASSYALAHDKIHAIYDLVNNQQVSAITYITSTRWAIMQPRQTPFKLSVDSSDRILFAFNMGVLTPRDSDISGDVTPPTVTTSPLDAATGVLVTANVVWTFNEAIQEICVNSSNFFVIKATDGAIVAGALSHDSTNKVVTFDPTSSLSGSTAYIAICTTAVKDLAGNALATAEITNFTTV